MADVVLRDICRLRSRWCWWLWRFGGRVFRVHAV